MDDVFISYASEDRARVIPLAQALEARHLSVWWDREIPPGATFDDVIETALNAAGCVVVVWTEHSIKSRWVRTEASAALERDRLVPVLLDKVAIPLEFRRVQAADLTEWHPGEVSEDFDLMLQSVERLLGHPAAGRRPLASPTAPLRPLTPESGNRRRLAIGAAALIAVALATWMALRPSGEGTGSAPAIATTAEQPAQTQSPAQAAPVPSPAVPAPPPVEPAAQASASRASQAPPQAAPAPVTTAPASVPAPSQVEPPPQATASRVSPAGSGRGSETAIAIKVGDRIEEGVPVAGAGVIARPYAETVYAFDAPARESVFFQVRKYETRLSGIRWRLTDSAGEELFNTCLGCPHPGVVELRPGGRYTLTVGGGDAATGAYSLQLTRVPPPDRFALELGSKPVKIAEGVPAAAAGTIEVPGARDLYTFTAQPKARVGFYLGSASSGMSGLRWRLTDGDGEELFDSCLGCSNPGVFELRKGGAYTLSVGGNADPVTGTYTARIVSVPPPTRIDLGTLDGTVRIAPGTPAAGAGEIDSPGAADVYAFAVPPRARVSVRIAKVAQGLSGIRLHIADEDEMEIHDTCLGCSDPGILDLSRGGAYTLTVGSSNDPATGAYELEIARVQ